MLRSLAPPAAGGRTGSMKNTWIALIVIVVVALALFFLFGKASAPSSPNTAGAGFAATSTLTTATTTYTAADGSVIVVPPGSPLPEDAPAYYFKG